MKDTTKKIYVFFGFGSEYVLHDLFLYMAKQGYSCIELSTINALSAVRKLVGKKIVLITSAHFLLDKHNFNFFYPYKKNVLCPLEIISILQPVKSIFIPHDLIQPVIDYELDYLSLFDAFLYPLPEHESIAAYCNEFAYVGWSKYIKNFSTVKLPNKHKSVWIFSEFQHHVNYGLEQTYQKLKLVLDEGVAIKFPEWPSADTFSDYFRRQGVQVIAQNKNTFEVISNADLVITNGISSVSKEAYLMGKKVVTFIDEYHDVSIVNRYFHDMPELIMVRFKNKHRFDISKCHNRTDTSCKIKQFDFRIAERIIAK